MADLFLIEYPATLTGMTDLKMSPQARLLGEAVAASRQHPGDDSADSAETSAAAQRRGRLRPAGPRAGV